jgi:hypothetical protein
MSRPHQPFFGLHELEYILGGINEIYRAKLGIPMDEAIAFGFEAKRFLCKTDFLFTEYPMDRAGEKRNPMTTQVTVGLLSREHEEFIIR